MILSSSLWTCPDSLTKINTAQLLKQELRQHSRKDRKDGQSTWASETASNHRCPSCVTSISCSVKQKVTIACSSRSDVSVQLRHLPCPTESAHSGRDSSHSIQGYSSATPGTRDKMLTAHKQKCMGPEKNAWLPMCKAAGAYPALTNISLNASLTDKYLTKGIQDVTLNQLH